MKGYSNMNVYELLLKFHYQIKAICWLDVVFKEKNSILDRDLNPGL